jgi:solute carrier family 8 (sodium/calcium exchanger)
MDPQPKGCKLSKRNICQIEIVPESFEIIEAIAQTEKMIEYFVEQNDDTWASQFKKAIILTPTINEDDEIDYVTGMEAFMHFASIGWKVFFALVPPPNKGGGWVAFGVALTFIGIVTAVVGETANLFGCALGLKQSVTAITFVAMGTSLPDTFASMQAAKEAPNADAAVGNVTGSNSVNVFLGLGLPWVIGAAYSKGKGNSENGMYAVPAGPLGFSVIVFIACCVTCILVLVIRRKVRFF